MPDHNTPNFWTDLYSTVIGSWGGMSLYLASVQKSGKFSMGMLAVHTLPAGFAGWLGAQLCVALELGPNWIGPVSGVFGVLGFDMAARIARRVLTARLGVPNDEDEQREHRNQG